MTIVGVQLLDRVDRRHLVIIGAIGMCISEFMVAIVRVTAGKITADTAVNLSPQKVFLIAFVYLNVFWIPNLFVQPYLHHHDEKNGSI